MTTLKHEVSVAADVETVWRTLSDLLAVKQHNTSHAIGLEVTASSWPVAFMKWRTELYADGPNTLIRQEMNYKLKFGVLGLLLDKLVMRRKLNASVQEVFGNLKSYVESTRT